MQQSENSMIRVNFGPVPPPPWEKFKIKALSRQDFRTCSLNGMPVVTTPAELDIDNVDQLGDALLDADADGTAVVVDMTATTFIDCTSLGRLIRTYKLLRENGVELRIAASHHRVRGLLACFGTDQWIRVFDTVSEAVTAMSAAAKLRTWSPDLQAAWFTSSNPPSSSWVRRSHCCLVPVQGLGA